MKEDFILIIFLITFILSMFECVVFVHMRKEVTSLKNQITELKQETDFAKKEAQTVYDLFIYGRFE